MLANMGADGVITDDPGIAVSCIAASRRVLPSMPPGDMTRVFPARISNDVTFIIHRNRK